MRSTPRMRCLGGQGTGRKSILPVDKSPSHHQSSEVGSWDLFELQPRESGSVCEECAPCIGVRRYRPESSDFRTMLNRRALAPPNVVVPNEMEVGQLFQLNW
jgi:hypothetical protein